MIVDPLDTLTNVGISGVAVYMIYKYSLFMSEKSFKQCESVQIEMNRVNQEMLDFMKKSFVENTKAINNMVFSLEKHMEQKDEFIILANKSLAMIKESIKK